ncbi:MAG: OPT/YSL family transporter, partial [Coriobacteriaceae bacterium]|nr:OPT/YSL family transporter [Coriobacteriaceae bacterium]
MGPLKGQLTLRGVLVGCVGCVIITASSLYVALKMGALPWPILFAAIVSLFFLKLLDKASKNPAGNPGGNPVGNPTGEPVGELTGKSEGNPVGNPVGNLGGKTSTTSLHEVNVTHTIMSAGAMVAGGLAFTIPGVWILGNTEGVDWWQMLAVALSGVVLGLVCTVCLRRHFIENAGLEYPMGEATAQTLLAGNAGGKVGRKLFGAFGFAGIYAALRDWLGVIPSMLLGGVQVPGIAFGIYNSPMLLAIGFLVGTAAIVAWLIGALIGNLGLVAGASLFGLWSAEEGRQIASSLGMGLMMGCGVAVVIKVIASAIRGVARGTGGGADSGALCGTARGMDRDATNGAAREKARASVNCEPREGTHKPWRESLLSGGHSGIKRMGAGFMAVALAGVALV